MFARWVLAAKLSLLVMLTACGSADLPLLPPAPPAPIVRNADEIAARIAGGRLTVTAFPERLRGHPIEQHLAGVSAWGALFEGTDIDPLRDFDTAFVTARNARDEDGSVHVAEHTLPAERVRAALGALVTRSGARGRWRPDLLPFAAEVVVRGRTRVVAAPTPTLLVALPPEHEATVRAFLGSGGLPLPDGPEAAVLLAAEPGETLAQPYLAVPPTLRSVRAHVVATADGGADLELDAPSESAEQATLDADALTRSVDRATSVRVVVVTVRVLRPVRFFAEGDRVRAHHHLSRDELARIFGFAQAFQ